MKRTLKEAIDEIKKIGKLADNVNLGKASMDELNEVVDYWNKEYCKNDGAVLENDCE